MVHYLSANERKIRTMRLISVVVILCLGHPTTLAFAPLSTSSLVHTKQKSTKASLLMSMDLVDSSYNLAIGAFGVGLAGGVLEDIKSSDGIKLPTAKLFGGLALVFTLFAGFLAFQTTTLRFGFDEDSFSLVRSSGSSLGENVVVGGENKWAYSSFQNWDFLPSSDFPILVYFREDQTPLENREEVPIVVDQLNGQVHFFPAIANSQKLKEGFLKHGCARVVKE